jgi:ankyrin repeat protein
MSAMKNSILRALIIILFISLPLKSGAQWELIQSIINSKIDTSEYIPEIYEGALDYNLMIAASRGYSSEINRLIARGADVNAETADGATPLVYAVSNNKSEAVSTILEYNPLVDKLTASYETPLMIATKNGFFEIAEKLIRAGANVNTGDRFGATSLHYAAIYGYTNIADLLLYYDADPDIKTTDGSTPLHGAIWAGNIDIADLLLQNSAKPDEKDNSGHTPFLLASYFGDTTAMNLLYNYGANINARDNNGLDALSLAIISNQAAAVDFILSIRKSLPENAPDPYSIASAYGRKDIVPILRKNGVPGKINYGIDKLAFNVSERFSLHDVYTGFTLTFSEPYLKAGFFTGLDTKLWYTRVLIKDQDQLYHQYRDKGSLVYAGLFRDFKLSEVPDRYNVMLSANLAAGYSFGNSLKGTLLAPENKFRVIPSVSLKYSGRNLFLNAGIEYIKSEFYRTGPIWFRIGVGYNYRFGNNIAKIKPPRWY